MFWKRKSTQQPEPSLLWLNGRDAISARQAYEGFCALGGTGSGKSSTLEHLMLALAERQAGMLFLTASNRDFEGIANVARAAGREADLIRFAPGERWRFDFLNYELSSPGGSVATASQQMQDLVDFATRTQTTQGNEPFWPLSAARKLRMAMTVIWRAQGTCSAADLYNFCITMPSNREEIESPAFGGSFCGECLAKAKDKGIDDDLAMAGEYVLREWPRLCAGTGVTAGCIDAIVQNVLERFVLGEMRELIASGTTNISPADLENGKLIAVDCPVLKFREAGQFVQLCWKLATQRYALRRILTPESRDICLWMDEAQLTALPQVDSMTQAVARKHKLIQVAITQNLPLLISVLKSREDALAWLGNLQTKFIFANGDKDTNEYFSGLFGHSRHLFGSSSLSTEPFDLVSDWFGKEQRGQFSVSENWHPDVPPQEFCNLRKGGREFGFMVDFYAFQGGREFSTGKTWIKASLKQRV